MAKFAECLKWEVYVVEYHGKMALMTPVIASFCASIESESAARLTRNESLFSSRATPDDNRSVLHVSAAGEDLVLAYHGSDCVESGAYPEGLQLRRLHGEAIHRV